MPERILKIRFALAFVLAAVFAGSAAAQEFDDWEGSLPFDGGWFEPPPSRVWAGLEFLGWWRKGRQTPNLVTIGDPGDAAPGALGEPGTQILFGGDRIGERIRPGAKVTLGFWFDPYETVAIGMNFWGVGEQTTRFNISSNGDPLLAIPFFDPGNIPNALVVAQAGQPGSIAIRSSSDVLGGDAYIRGFAMRGPEARIDWLVGYQMARIDEDLVINSDAPGNFFAQDAFLTKNEFHGGALGLTGQIWRGAWFCEFLAKVGLGSMRQTVTVTGTTDAAPAGGLFVEGVDLVQVTRSQFCVVPEANIKFGMDLNPFTRLTVGYSYLYFSHVVQPGSQIDPVVGDGVVSLAFTDHGYWVHGLNMGIDWRY